MVDDTLPETATQTEFAKIIRRRRSYVTQLKKDGRLVLAGRRVKVRESIDRIEATRDPSKQGVAERHEKARHPDIGTGDDITAAESEDDTSRATSGYQHWRERSERAKALQAERENAKAEGELVEARHIGGAAESAGAVFRSATENLVLELAPELADIRDEQRIAALLTQRFHDMLQQLAATLEQMTRGG